MTHVTTDLDPFVCMNPVWGHPHRIDKDTIDDAIASANVATKMDVGRLTHGNILSMAKYVLATYQRMAIINSISGGDRIGEPS